MSDDVYCLIILMVLFGVFYILDGRRFDILDKRLEALEKDQESVNQDTTERKHPSDQKCPYCGANWNMTIQRSKCLQKHGAISIVCGKCNGMFTVKFEDDKYVCRPFYKGGDK